MTSDQTVSDLTLPDLILSDYTLPQFDAPHALRILRELELDIPFIIVSGSIGEDLAVRAMQEGASDYLLKDRLGRLGQAVKGALAQQDLRHSLETSDRRRVARDPAAVAAIGQFDSTAVICSAAKYDGHVYRPTWVSQSVEHLTGYADTEFLAPEWWLEHVHPHDLDRALDVMSALTTRGTSTVEYRFRCSDGSYRWLFDQKRLIRIPPWACPWKSWARGWTSPTANGTKTGCAQSREDGRHRPSGRRCGNAISMTC